jgi:hypothetical protein
MLLRDKQASCKVKRDDDKGRQRDGPKPDESLSRGGFVLGRVIKFEHPIM